ncbi:unnamed protein product [Auanema sp. JU1783]|nr:unnamed protein product [Auanema sp. JU1783]
MTSKFLKFFRKNSSNKENDHSTELDRDMSYRHSTRSSKQSSRGERSTRFNCPEGLSPTAPYHTVTAPKLNKGPQSCPGGYRDRDDYRHEDMNRSFETELHPRRDRRDKYEFRDKYRRSVRDTSEYGSGDPSPIGNYGRHYPTNLIGDSDTEEYEYSAKIAQMEEACNRFKSRLKHSEERHFYYKDQCKQLLRAKEATEKAFLNQITTMNKDKQKLINKVQQLEQQLMHLRMSQSNTFCPPTNHFAPPTFSYGLSNGQQLSNRLSMGPQLSALQSNTPTSSALAASFTGAGEALTEESDLSCLQQVILDSSFSSRQTTEEMDETKDFRGESGMETPRTGTTSTSSMIDRNATPTLREECLPREIDGSRSTVVPENVQAMKMERAPKLKRSISDGGASCGDLRLSTI